MLHPTSRVMIVALAAVASVLSIARARADDLEYNDFRIGGQAVFYHQHSDDVAGPYVPPGVNLHFENFGAFYAGYVRTLSTHVAVELAGGVPPLLKTEGRGPATLGSVPYDGQLLSTTRILAPSVFGEYVFLDPSDPWRPFVGVGVNYTVFYARHSTPEGDAVNGGPTRFSLTSSVGPAATVGMGYRIAAHWHAYASYSAVRADSQLTTDTAGVLRRSRLTFNPQAAVVSLGYGF